MSVPDQNLPATGYPLSPLQQRLWQRSIADGLSYRIEAQVTLRGTVETAMLQRALDLVLSHNEILRTTFHQPEGRAEPLQMIHDGGRVPMDGDTGPSPIDVRTGPQVRSRYVRHSSSEHSLWLTVSSLCADPESVNNLVRQIADAYDAGVRHHDAVNQLPQFADIAEWQREELSGGDGGPGRTFWRQQTAVPGPDTPLPGETAAEVTHPFAPRLFTKDIDAGVWAEIRQLAGESGTHPQTWLLSCWKILIARLTRETGVVVHCYSDGRTLEELADAVGPLGRYVPLRTKIDADAAVRQVARSVHELQTLGHQWHHSFAGAAGGDVLVGTGFDFFEPASAQSRAGVTFSIERVFAFMEPFTLRLACVARPNGLNVTLHYDGRCFDEPVIQGLAERFEVLLREAAERPETAVGRLNILTKAERQTLLVDFNNTAADYPHESCVHHFIERQADETPAAVAVLSGDGQLDYGGLNRRANQLARHLQACGVGPNVLVGICLERSIEMVVSILGVLKAGGAYVPLDPAYPRERLHFMLEDTAAAVIVTSEHLADRLPNASHAVFLDRDAAAIDRYPATTVESAVSPQDLVYVIYTSGSTGKPKGVMITHQGLVISHTARLAYYQQPIHKFLLLSSFSFDSSVVGIFWSLCTGGTLVLVPEDVQKTPAGIARVVAEEHISHLLTLPSFYSLILEHAAPGQLDPLQTVIVAGEACPRRMVDRHKRLLPGTALFSEYGATETTVFNSVYDCLAQTLDTAPIGRPIDNAEIYLLDENLQPVPTGVPGEAYFGGAALSPGYLNRPELNAERFVTHPFSSDPAARLYKSGDLLRHLAGGDVEFLGRTDNQVKIRGFRIELEEIEAVLLRHPTIREAAVLAVTAEDWHGKDASPAPADDAERGGKRLAAYVAVTDGPPPIVSDLRRFLADQLPDHMVPSAFVVLGSLPKHPNGKIDRRALPAPGSVRAETELAYEAPRSETEKTLAEIWRHVLGAAQVGIHDNFFELGGDSILSIQIVARASRAGLSVTPMQVFQHQTIAELAEHVRVAQHVTTDQGDVVGDVPLSPIQHWFCERRSPNMHHWNMPLLLQVQDGVVLTDLEQAAQALARHHDALRLRLRPSGTGWLQHVAPPEETPLVEWVDLSEVPAAEQQSRFEVIAATYQQSLNLETGPLMRLVVFDFGPARQRELFWVLHHLAGDIVSWRILLEDLETALEQLASGGPVRLPAKTTSFQRWSELLQQYARSDAAASTAGFWLADDRRNAAPIPIDRAHTQGGNTEDSLRRFQVRLSRDETDRLLHDVPKAYQTQINEVLLTALLRSVSEWSDQPSLLVEVESHGREEDLFENVDLSRTVGWFTTYYPVCLRSDPGSSLEETLQSVKQQLRAIPERGFHYSLLRYLTPQADLADDLRRLPQADINFNYLGQFGQVLRNSSLFSSAPRDVNCGLDRSPRGQRSHLLDVVSWVVDGCLLVDWYYSENVHETSTIERLGQGFIEAVRSLLDHQKTHSRGQTATPDHDAFGWELQDLEGIAAAIQKARGAVATGDDTT